MKLTVIEARLTRDTEFFGKMDPYVTIQHREDVIQTSVKKSAGKEPKWDQEFTLNVKYIGDDIRVQVLDKDPLKSDLIGEALIKLSALCMADGYKEWFTLTFEGKSAGKIHLGSVWKPDLPAMYPPQGQPQFPPQGQQFYPPQQP